MDRELIRDVLDRLEAAPPTGERAPALVRTALLGDGDDVRAVLDGHDPQLQPPPAAASPDAAAGGISLSEIVVQGFRGIGPEAVLELDPGRGLTLVVGRNGSGKSSFAEALELLLTDDSYRWKGRAKAWRDGWRNVHHDDDRHIELKLRTAGTPGETVLRRTWAADGDLDDGTDHVEVPDGAAPPDWQDLVDTYRPVLSYAELGSMLDEGPSKLHDAMASVLGLDDLTAAASLLAEVRKERAALDKEVKAAAGVLRTQLEDTDDDRARDAVAILAKRGAPDLDALAELASGETAAGADGTDDLARARQLADLVAPDPERVAAVAAELRAAADALDATAGTDADLADRTAQLLRTALGVHDHVGDGDCPVCGRVAALDPAWRRDTEAEVARLDGLAAAARQARARLDRARGDAEALRTPPTPLLESDLVLPVDADAARAAWAAFSAATDDAPAATADHLDATAPALVDALADLSERAERWWHEHQDRWRPCAEALASWVADARRARSAAADGKAAKAAEDWLTDTTLAVQAERFAPTATRARELWDTMRCSSNVSIDDIALAGRATKRHVAIDVSVDGTTSAALGVMSQGELNTLALSLFLPRATLDASPFRFVVIDDPVQSMDPARVDGLARALADVARTRQVVVFTHDDRLPESVRRLQIPASVVAVQRRVGSKVETHVTGTPATVYLRDARHVMKMRDVPDDVRTTVVPTLYRQALEAVALDVVRRRWIDGGRDRVDVEERLADLELTALMSYLLFDRRIDDKSEIYAQMRTRFGPDVEQAVSTCNRASHEGYAGDLGALERQVEAAVARIGAAS